MRIRFFGEILLELMAKDFYELTFNFGKMEKIGEKWWVEKKYLVSLPWIKPLPLADHRHDLSAPKFYI